MSTVGAQRPAQSTPTQTGGSRTEARSSLLGRLRRVRDPSATSGRPTPLGAARAQKLGLGMFAVLAPLAVAGALVLRRRRVAIWILIVPLVAVCVTALVTYGNQRFREPADLVLVVFAAVALDAFWRRREAGRVA